MTQYNSINVKLLKSHINTLKLAIKNETDVILRLSSNMIGNSDNETNIDKLQIFTKPLLTTHQLI